MADRRHGHDCGDECPNHHCSPGCDASFQTALGSAAGESTDPPVDLLSPLLRLDLKQLHDTLRALPQSFVRSFLNNRRIGTTRSTVSMDSAKKLHERLYRAPESQRNRELLMLLQPLAALVRAPRGLKLSADDCAALLTSAESARMAMREQPNVAYALEAIAPLPDAARLCGLAAAFASCRPAPPLAIALLLADPAAPPGITDQIGAAWQAMRAHRGSLPADPMHLPRLAEEAALAVEHLGDAPIGPPSALQPHAPISSGEAAEPMPDPGPGAEEQRSAAAANAATHHHHNNAGIGDLATALDRLRSHFGSATGAIARIGDAIAAGRRPDSADLGLLGALATDMDRLGERLCAITGADPQPASLADLAGELDQARAHAEYAGLQARFASLDGPEEVASALTEIRTAAASPQPDASTTERLRLVAELVDRTAANPYDATRADLLRDVLERAPGSWYPAVMAAMQDQLTLAPAPSTDLTTAHPHAERSAQSRDPADPPEDAAAASGGAVEPTALADDALADLDAALDRESATTSDAEPLALQAPPATPAPPEPGDGEPPVPAGPVDRQPSRLDAAASTAPAGTTDAAQPAESPALPSADPAPNPAHTPRSPTIAAQDLAALQQRWFGLAGWLARAADLPANTATTRFAAACADQIQGTTGPMAEAFRERADALYSDPPAEPSDRLLAWATAVRAALVAPTAEATELIEQTSVVNSQRPALRGIGDAVRTAAKSGIYVDLSSTGEHLRDSADAQHGQETAVEFALRLSADARTRKISYQPATEIWRRMVSPGGALWPLLDIPAQDDTARLGGCRRLVAELRAPAAVDGLIDRLHKESKSSARKGRTRIVAGARSALRKNIEEVRDNAQAWADSVQQVAALRDPRSAPDYTTRGLNQLQQQVTRLWDDSVHELEALRSGSDPSMGAAAAGAQALLGQAHDLLRGGSANSGSGGREPSVAMALHRHLLLIPRIQVSATGEPAEAPTLDELTGILHTAPDWPAACQARIGRDDFVGADLTADLVRENDLAAADRLGAQIGEHLAAARRRLQDAGDAFRAEAALRWRNGALTEEEANRLREAAAALANNQDRRDFSAMTTELAELRAESDRLCDQRIAERKDEVRRAAEDSDHVARYAERLRGYLDGGQITSSDELLAQLKANQEIVQRTEEIDHFAAFYPEFPRVLEQTRGKVRKNDSMVHPVIPELFAQLSKDPRASAPALATPEHRELVAGLLESQGSGGGRATAAEALRQWRTVAQGPKSSRNLGSVIERILRLLGIEARLPDAPTLPQHRDRLLRIDLTRVSLTGDALLPAFGSKMSPSGDQITLCLLWHRPEPGELFEWLRDIPQDRTVLALYFGLLTRAQRQELAELSRGRRESPVIGVVDDAAVSYLAALARPQWSTTVRLVAPFTATRPFQAQQMIPKEMFYGREEDLSAVMASSGAHFVYGGRQLGKSVLLAEAGRRLRAQGNGTVVVERDVYEIGRSQRQVDHFWTVLGGTLLEHAIVSAADPTPADKEEVCDAIRAWSRANPDKRLLLFFDEADEFLNLDAEEHHFANVVALRELMNATGSRVKAVFAGLHKIARFRSYPNQPFANLGESLGIGPLSSPDAFDLLTRPLRTLGLHLPEELAVSVIAQANNAPALVQYFGDLLLQLLQKQKPVTLPYQVTLKDINDVRSDPVINKAFHDRFEWTLDLDKRYKVIAYAVALQTMDERGSTVDEKELWNACRDWWGRAFEKCTMDEFGALLEECVDLGVLAETSGAFHLRTPHILNLLGGRIRVEQELQEANATYQLPDSFDAASYRLKYGGGPELSPLTAAQTARLGSADGRIRLIVGSEALQFQRVASALDSALYNVQARCRRVEPRGETFEGALHRARGRRKDITLVTLRDDITAAAEQIEAADRALTQAPEQRLNIILLATPAHAPLISTALGPGGNGPAAEALEKADVVELRRFGKSGVRQWRLLDDFARIADESFHPRLFEATGGWPSLVNAVIRDVVEKQYSPAEAVRRREQYLTDNPDNFVASTGITHHPGVFAAWRTIVEQGAETHDDLSLILELTAGHAAGQHGEVMEIDHYGRIGVLRALGALVPGENSGRLTPEPVLLRAYRASGFMPGGNERDL